MYNNEDELYSILINMDDISELCMINKTANKICHSKQFLIDKLEPYKLKPTYENLMYFNFLAKLADKIQLYVDNTYNSIIFKGPKNSITTLYPAVNNANYYVLEHKNKNTEYISDDDIISSLIWQLIHSSEYYIYENEEDQFINYNQKELYNTLLHLNDIYEEDIEDFENSDEKRLFEQYY